jgi:hypothetical protein
VASDCSVCWDRAADLLDLQSPTVGFSFDWRITFSTSSLAKAEVAGLFKPVGTSGEWRSNASTYDLAEAHDSAEFWNALIHHPFTPGTRPLIRGFMDLVQGVLRFVHHALLLFYWATRSVYCRCRLS